MNDEQYEAQYGAYPEINRFESPEAISKHIFGVKKSPASAYNEDTVRANLEMGELNSVKTSISLISLIAYVEQFMVDSILEESNSDQEKEKQITDTKEQMERLKNFFRDEQAGTTVPTRSKRGFSIYMSKTTKNVQTQDMTDYGLEQQETFNPQEQQQGIRQKITSAIPFLKKKEM